MNPKKNLLSCSQTQNNLPKICFSSPKTTGKNLLLPKIRNSLISTLETDINITVITQKVQEFDMNEINVTSYVFYNFFSF